MSTANCPSTCTADPRLYIVRPKAFHSMEPHMMTIVAKLCSHPANVTVKAMALEMDVEMFSNFIFRSDKFD